MIWYLLYPLRGTTQTPVLGPSHPLRIAFTRYGTYITHHIVTTLLVSIAVAAILIYPIPYLYTNDFINGASNLPHHVWTVAQPLNPQSEVVPDVVMRSIWVHGSYMEALDRRVLLGALELQDEILGPTRDFDPRRPSNSINLIDLDAELSPVDRDSFHVINGLTNQSWFFHSPLQYWSCSSDNIASDKNIVSTVNQRKTQPTSVNVTLRHSIVFSGKRFEDRQLAAADALVITLIHLRDSPIAKQWLRHVENLPQPLSQKWDVYPSDGRVSSSQLYDFQFRPMSTQDALVLASVYGLTLVLFLASLSKLRAVKSKFGLIATIVTQIIVSSLSSFTVCAVFQIDLSRIPRAAYPLVVLSMSLENIFRLINAVILTQAEDKTSSRVGAAFGEVAHVSLASSAQNVFILWALSRVVSPGVSAFCNFAAVAIVFDFFYLSTFFLAVLSLDVRRTELNEFLAKSSLKRRVSNHQQSRSTWLEALLSGRIELSTRLAGTFVCLGSVLMAQWHFFDNQSIMNNIGQLFRFSGLDSNIDIARSSTLLSGIHQARSPTSWLRLQDHETAREVINVIKPWAHSYVAQVYEPIVFVLKGSDRMPHTKELSLLPAAYDFIRHQLTPFVFTVLFVLALVRLLTNFLLWDEAEMDDQFGIDGHNDDPTLSIKTLEGGHVLDVALITSFADSRIVSIGLDRSIHIWDTRTSSSYEVTKFGKPKDNPFPVFATAVDCDTKWLAILSPFRLLLWSLLDHKWSLPVPVNIYGQKPVAFFLDSRQNPVQPSAIIVFQDGVLLEIQSTQEQQEARKHVIHNNGTITCGAVSTRKKARHNPLHPCIVTTSSSGQVHITSYTDNGSWKTNIVQPRSLSTTNRLAGINQVLFLNGTDLCLLVGSQFATLVDVVECHELHTLTTEPIQGRSMKATCSRRRNKQSGINGVASLTLFYIHATSGDCVIQAYSRSSQATYPEALNPNLDSKLSPSEALQESWLDQPDSVQRVPHPGTWEVLPSGLVIGVRKVVGPQQQQQNSYAATGSDEKSTRFSPTKLRHRKVNDDTQRKPWISWEVWFITQVGKADGGFETRPLLRQEDENSHLIVSDLGPITKVGHNSVVVGYGNVMKLITVWNAYCMDGSNEDDDDDAFKFGSRRRKQCAFSRGKVSVH